MISDEQTNMIYYSSGLRKRFPHLTEEIINHVIRRGLKEKMIHGLADLKIQLLYPLQVSIQKFIQFGSDISETEYARTTDIIDRSLNNTDKIEIIKSSIRLDRRNIVSFGNRIILSEEVITGNPEWKREELLNELRRIFDSDKLILIPGQGYWFSGKINQMVRFINDRYLLLCEYNFQTNKFKREISALFNKYDLETVPFPHHASNFINDSGMNTTEGSYLNYLQLSELILLPVYGSKLDDTAAFILEAIFSKSKVKTMQCNELAQAGLDLNSIVWNARLSPERKVQ